MLKSLSPILVVVFGLAFCSEAQESISSKFHYLGTLHNGSDPAEGIYSFQFKLLGTEGEIEALSLDGVEVKNGQITVPLEFSSASFDGGDRWIQLGIRTNVTAPYVLLDPPLAIGTSPHALLAERAKQVEPGVIGPEQIQPLSIQNQHLSDGAITKTKLAGGLVDAFHIADGTVVRSVNGFTEHVGLSVAGDLKLVQQNGQLTIAYTNWSQKIYNVKSFGAVGNGTVDDTAAITSAIATWTVNGGTLYFPPGTYLDNTNREIRGITLPSITGRSGYLRLQGSELSIWKFTGTGTHITLKNGISPTNLRFDSMIFLGPGKTNSSTVAIDMLGIGGNMVYENCIFRNWGTAAIRADDQTFVKIGGNTQFRDNTIGLALGYKTDGWEIDCRLDWNDVGIEFGHFNPDFDPNNRTNTKLGNAVRIRAVGAYNGVGILVGGTGTRGITIHNSYIESSFVAPIQIGHDPGVYTLPGQVEKAPALSVRILDGYFPCGSNPDREPIQVFCGVARLVVDGNFFEGLSSSAAVSLKTLAADNSNIEYRSIGASKTLRNSRGDVITRAAYHYGMPTVFFSSWTQSYHTPTSHNFYHDYISRLGPNQNVWRAGRNAGLESFNSSDFTAGWHIGRDSAGIDVLQGTSSYLKPSTFSNLPTPSVSYLGMIANVTNDGPYACVRTGNDYSWVPVSGRLPLTSKNADYTATHANRVIHADASSSPVTITLPAGLMVGGGSHQFTVMKKDPTENPVTIRPLSGFINGDSFRTLTTQYQSETYYTDGTNYFLLR